VVLPPVSPARHNNSDTQNECSKTDLQELSQYVISTGYPHMESLFHNDFLNQIYEAGIFDDGQGLNNIINAGFDE
jgi:hypothetical protein